MTAGLAGARVWCTGRRGFLRQHVVAHARAAGAIVAGAERDGEGEVDVADAGQTREFVLRWRPTVIVHAAARVRWRPDPEQTLALVRANVLGTASVLEAARGLADAQPRVVVVGSASEAVTAPPREVYTVSKRAATELAWVYAEAFGLWVTVARPFNVYGPGEAAGRLFPAIFGLARAGGGELPCSAGTQRRDFVAVEDVAEGVLRMAVTDACRGVAVELGTGVGTAVREAVVRACAVAGGSVRPRFGALPLAPHEPEALVADAARTRALLGWAPSRTLDDGLRAMWDHFRQNAPPPASLPP